MNLIDILNKLIEALCAPLKFIIELLPSSPFKNLNFDVFDSFLGYLNWVVPVGDIIKILSLWCACVGGYYIYSIALRWLKAVE